MTPTIIFRNIVFLFISMESVLCIALLSAFDATLYSDSYFFPDPIAFFVLQKALVRVSGDQICERFVINLIISFRIQYKSVSRYPEFYQDFMSTNLADLSTIVKDFRSTTVNGLHLTVFMPMRA